MWRWQRGVWKLISDWSGGEGEDRVDNSPMLWYLGRPLDKTDEEWMAVRRNIMCARLIWGRLGTLIQHEEAEPRVAVKF